ncbi:hypothetical protein FMZ60_08990 [Alcaligenaceae bacterium SJ-26]|nr:hypothetical protein FMZ60_08990 [Alcaligenaceae bacterium SJ-26]
MSTDKMPWLRLYTEAVDDEKLRLLAFEDRWHFVALLCCKGAGILNAADTPELMRRKVAVKLGLDMRAFEEAIRRLSEVGLVDQETLQPVAWEKRQHRSDTSAERTRKYRENKKKNQGDGTETKGDGHGDGVVTSQQRHGDALDTDTEEDTDINPPQTPPTEGGGEAGTKSKPKRIRHQRTTLKGFFQHCIEQGEKPISTYKPLLEYVEASGLPMEFVNLAWTVFKAEHLQGGANERRRQSDWRQHFLNYVTKGYYRLWYARPGGDGVPAYELTTQGLQAQAATQRREAA